MLFRVISAVLCLIGPGLQATMSSNKEVAISGTGTVMKCCGSNDTCPYWSKRTSHNCCDCRSSYTHHTYCAAVGCKVLNIQNCYCLWFATEDAVLAPCFYTCYNTKGILYYHVNYTENHTEFNQQMCSGAAFGLELHRDPLSQLCGRCERGYGLPTYSYQFSKCVLCPEHVNNYLAYIAAAFVPLTVFYFIVIIFRISATSGSMNGCIFFSQVITSPLYMRFFVSAEQAGHFLHTATYLKVVYTFHAIWNLDFFRLIYKPFCIHSHLTAQGILCLDYIVAIYPLLLVMCTYGLVVLHERDYKLIVFLWMPFHKCFSCFRSQWSIKTTLVHAFSTFLLLSYVKILSVSFDLLLPSFAVRLPSLHGRTYFYYDSSLFLFDSRNFIYFILAAIVILLCMVLLVIMLAYPCRCFHRCVNISQPAFHIFMDTFVGYYRQNPSYCIAFPGMYFLFRVLILAVFELTSSLIYIPTISVVVLLAAILIALVRPYKKLSHNVTDVIFLIHLAICFNIQSEVLITNIYGKTYFFSLLFVFALALPVFYPVFLMLRFVYYSSFMDWIRRRCVHGEESQELVRSVQASGSRYGAMDESVK